MNFTDKESECLLLVESGNLEALRTKELTDDESKLLLFKAIKNRQCRYTKLFT